MTLIPPTETFGNRDPPAKEPKEQYLFLLEFFVHHVSGERLAKLNRMFFVPTRISFKFLNFEDEDISITPVDPSFEPLAGIADDVERFNAGRSVMFAVASRSVTARDVNFTVKMLVEKKMPENIKPDIVVGCGELDMSDHFAALRKELLQCWHTNYPPPKIFEGDVDLVHEGQTVGSVAIYVSISGFGQSIVTEIETPVAEKKSSSYVFKSPEKDDEQLAYKCRKIDSRTMDVCQDSQEDLSGEPACQVCQPTRHFCSPCEMLGAGEKPACVASVTPGDGRIREGPGGESDSALKSILCGKPFSAPWEPKSSPHVTKSSEQLRMIREFKEEARLHVLPIQSSRGPAEPCGKAVVLKVSGLLDVDDPDGRRKQPTVTVARDNGSPDLDDEHDVFILRIGKKGLVGAGEKSDIQLEMRTPKGPERRPPIRYETREIQTEEESKAGGQKAKGKGKGNGNNKKKKKK